jgi:hypothetical protein
MDFGFLLLPVVIFLGIVLYGLFVVLPKRRFEEHDFGLFLIAALLLAFTTWSAISVLRNENLMLAAMRGDVVGVREQLERGADPNSEWETGSSALHFAAKGGRTEVVKLLLEHGANPAKTTDSSDVGGDSKTEITAAQVAERQGHHELARLLERAARGRSAP